MKKWTVVALAIAIMFSLGGCAGKTVMFHPHKDQAAFERDKYDCMQDARLELHQMGETNNVFGILVVRPAFERCMRYKHGWQF